ncbi:unnamed protein product [Cochlearia groenlandica]
MAERKLNLDAPRVSTRRIKKEVVSVRRNMAKKLTLTDDDDDDDHTKTSESLSPNVLVQDMSLDQASESASVTLKCPLEKDIVGTNHTRLHSSKSKHVVEEEEESEDDDVFSDALDTLSLKHNTSDVGEIVKPPLQSMDHQDNFMLNRFLPAAKSMTVKQKPQYASKRQPLPAMSEPMRQIRDILPAENHSTPKWYGSNISPSYYHGIDGQESEEDEDEDEVSEYLSKRGCGMSPQLCFKNSLGMLSSVHGLKEKPSRHDQVKSSKVSLLKSRFRSVKKLALDSIYKPKLGSRAQSPVHPSVGKKYNFGSEQLEPNMSSTASMPSSPYRQIGCMSPYRSVGTCSPLHPAGFPGTRKEAEIMRANRLNKHIRITSKSQDLLLYPKSTRLDCSTSSVIEKTLYVDTQKCPKTKDDHGNSSVKILPETAESEMVVETPSSSIGIKKMKEDELENKNRGCKRAPLALPTPKKPSDSWLFRNLPSLSSKISSRRYLLHPSKKDLEENSTSVTKWETIVKTSCMNRDYIRYSEELVARSSCQSTT